MERVNLFRAPHKVIRGRLAELSTAIGKLDDNNKGQVERFREMAEALFVLTGQHAETEETYILPHLEGKSSVSPETDREQHDALHEMEEYILNVLKESRDPSAKIDWYDLGLRFSQYHALQLEHMFHEETVTQQLLWNHYSDEELTQIRVNFIQRMERSKLILWYKEMFRFQNDSENATLLFILKSMFTEHELKEMLGY